RRSEYHRRKVFQDSSLLPAAARVPQRPLSLSANLSHPPQPPRTAPILSLFRWQADCGGPATTIGAATGKPQPQKPEPWRIAKPPETPPRAHRSSTADLATADSATADLAATTSAQPPATRNRVAGGPPRSAAKRLDGPPGLLFDKVGVDHRARERASRGRRAHLGEQVGNVPRRPHPGHLGAAGGVGGNVHAHPARVLARLQPKVGEEPGPG